MQNLIHGREMEANFQMNALEKYIGRSVRLKKHALDELPRRRSSQRRDQDSGIENYFLVATVSRELRKLICYGANMRIEVGAADVVLI